MIRNVVTGRLRAPLSEQDDAAVDAALAGIAALDLPGLLSNLAGRDARLRDGTWSYAIVNDWVDADAYRRYDSDPEHLRHRTTLVALSEQVARVQTEAPDPGAPDATVLARGAGGDPSTT